MRVNVIIRKVDKESIDYDIPVRGIMCNWFQDAKPGQVWEIETKPGDSPIFGRMVESAVLIKDTRK